MSKLSHKVRHDLRLSVSDRMELADALDAMESALRAARRTMIDLLESEIGREVTPKDMGPSFHKLDAALLKLEGK